MKTIYNTYVEMQSQEQCDRMKQLCLDNGLNIWDWEYSFKFRENLKKVFEYNENAENFYCNASDIQNDTKVTEEEFIELLKNK